MKSLSLLLVLSCGLFLVSGCSDSGSTVIEPTDEAPATVTDEEMESEDYEKAMNNL